MNIQQILMRHFVFHIIILTLITACSADEIDRKSENSDREDFNEFFYKFTYDSLFQLERIKFPFEFKNFDSDGDLTVDQKERNDWKFLVFEYKEEYGKRELDAYTQETKIYSDRAKLEIRGVDNGIYVDFNFNYDNGKWFLVSGEDYSN